MSIKTIYKKIALVAVSVLGVSVVTALPAQAANAAENDVWIVAKSGLINVGACSITTGTTNSTSGADGVSGTFGNGSSVLLAATTADDLYLSITGPAVWSRATAADGTTANTVTTTATTMFDDDGTAGDLYTLTLSGVGTVTVTVAATSSSAAVDTITINSVASCATSTYAAAKSNFTITTLNETDTDHATGLAWVTAFNGVDTADQEIVTSGGTGYARAQLNNEYGDNLSSKPVIATGTATAGGACWVTVEASDTTAGGTAPTASTSVLTSTGEDLTILVKSATAGVASTCSVNLTWNGISIGTKVFKLQGAVASLAVSGVTVGAKSGHGYFRVAAKDSLGNALPSVSISNDNEEANNARSLTIVSDASSNTTSTGASTDASTGAIYGTTPAVTAARITDGTVARYSCTSKGGAAKITVRALQSGITYVTSAPFDVYCGAASIDTWSISLDKASYAPGEIATLTVSAKDSDGHLASSTLALGSLEQAFGGMTFVTTPTSADTFSSGAGFKTYQLSVGTTEGAFVGTFKLTGTTDTAAKTVQYKVASATPGVTNADVLKSIVSLIASINKQIQALQKLILRR